MKGFDEVWLADYRRKQLARAAAMPEIDRAELRLDAAFLLLNKLIRMHWTRRASYAASIANRLAPQMQMAYPSGWQPLERARVTITRYSSGTADIDGLHGGAKPLIDCLLVRSKTHPFGLGLVVDDAPRHMDLHIAQERTSRRASGTRVVVEAIP